MLSKFGLKNNDKFICLAVRDRAYQLKKMSTRYRDWKYHDFRHIDIDQFVLAAEELTKRGYYVFRMGVVVEKPFKSKNPKIIDYANSNLRSDFMDIYLGAKCTFCLTNGTGLDAIPSIFRRPIAYANFVPVEYFSTFSNRILGIFKHHFSIKSDRNLSLREIFMNTPLLTASNYESKDILLIENTPEEIRDVAIEMHERINGTWQLHDDDELLQQKFSVDAAVDEILSMASTAA